MSQATGSLRFTADEGLKRVKPPVSPATGTVGCLTWAIRSYHPRVILLARNAAVARGPVMGEPTQMVASQYRFRVQCRVIWVHTSLPIQGFCGLVEPSRAVLAEFNVINHGRITATGKGYYKRFGKGFGSSR